MNLGLSNLIAPLSLQEFLEYYQKGEPFVVETGPDLLKVIETLPYLNSLDALTRSWPFPVDAHLPDLRDEASTEVISINQVDDYFSQGMGLLFNDIQRISPELTEWTENIRKDLGLSQLTYGRNLVYVTPDGKGTAPHFDQNINFVLQLHGTKVWKMAKNQDIDNPLTRHTMGQMPDPEMMSYLTKPLSEKMPENTEEFVLKPGSLLFVPRGYWHETQAEGDALALNFTFTAPAWLDLLTAALRGRLAQSSEWRATAYPQDVETFQGLMNELIQDLPHWKAQDVLAVTDFE